jgi:hypothetical protein
MRKVTTATLVLALLVAASDLHATTVSCQRSIAKAGSLFVVMKAKALAVCERNVVAGTSTGPCPDDKATNAIAKAREKLSAMIGKACGGDDLVCGGDPTNEYTPASLGWPDTCPDFEHGSCDNPIADCGGIAECLACVGSAAVDQAMSLYYDELALPSAADAVLNRCQGTIGKAPGAFLITQSKALQRCWDARLTGAHGNDCIPPAPGDGKYLAAIDYAERKTVSAICTACGGADQACGGGDDLTPAAIGFASTCPAVTIPGGAACGGPIPDLQSIVDCVNCVSAFKADCADRLQVPELAAYPSECNVCTAPPPTGSCPTAVELTVDGAYTDLDLGWTGLAHNAKLPSNDRLTLAISDCAGASEPSCGECDLSGPVENAGGAAFTNHRCEDAPWVPCSLDGDCTGAGVAGPCVFFLGAPLPSSAGGIPTCILNQVDGPVTGTIDVENGSSTIDVPLLSKVHVTGTLEHPCPNCTDDLCTDGPRTAQACTVMGTGLFGDVSLDCPPNPAADAGPLRATIASSTGYQSVSVTAASPRCTEAGYTTKRCLCDTCNNGNAEACMTNGDCPVSGGNPGICGGRRCLGGANEGAPCAGVSTCPGGTCNRPGEPTRPNPCFDDDSTPIDGTSCIAVAIGSNEGECPEGPNDSFCSLDTSRPCSTDADCGAESCPECAPGQTCVITRRACFLDNGIVGGSVSVTGSADVPCGVTARPAVGALFCVPPSRASTINVTRGLPGLARVRSPLRAVLNP